MSPGKIASQSGHAFLGSYLQCRDPKILQEYHKEFPASPGTKVCLKVKNLEQLLLAELKAKELGIPYFRVIDSGCANFFNGEPTITALGLGPATREQMDKITRKFKLL